MQTIRKPAVAGMFYPGNETTLREEILDHLNAAKTDADIDNIFGIVAPHAGYKYSGNTAATVYNFIRNKDYQTVFVISPSHREYFPGSCIYEGDAYKTPLGLVNVNDKLRSKLIEGSKSIFTGTHGHNMEHALEVQLPFLQVALNDFTIVPIVMGDQTEQFVNELAERLAEVVDDKTLVVASSDLSHFHSKQQADKLDSRAAARIEEFDFDGLMKDLAFKNCEACGGGPIAAMMKAAKLKGHNNSKVIARSDSGDITGDNSEVVGYLSAVIF